MTDPERLLWGRLRDHRLNGFGFRRQVPMGRYVADFVCHAAKLVVELDGGQHAEAVGISRDVRRDAWFAAEGYLVARFWNHDVLTALDTVVETIHSHALARTSSPGGDNGAGDPR